MTSKSVSKLNDDFSSAGNNIDIGGAELASSFIRLGLVNEIHLYQHPVLLGNGKPMFPETHQQSLRPIDVKTFQSGVVLMKD